MVPSILSNIPWMFISVQLHSLSQHHAIYPGVIKDNICPNQVTPNDTRALIDNTSVHLLTVAMVSGDSQVLNTCWPYI